MLTRVEVVSDSLLFLTSPDWLSYLPLPGGGYRNGDVGVFIDSRAASPLARMGPWALGGTWPLPGPAMQPWSVFPSILLGTVSWS